VAGFLSNLFGPRITAGVARIVRGSSSDPDNRDEAYQWRKIGAAKAKNLAAYDHLRMVQECTQSAVKDGFGKAHVRLVTAITVGAGEMFPSVRCEDEAAREKAQKLLLETWNDPVNTLSTALPEFMRGLCTTGSLCLTVHTGDTSKRTRVGYVDPASFVEPFVLTDPGNVREPIAVLRGNWNAMSDMVAHPVLGIDGLCHQLMTGAAEGRGAPIAVGSKVTLPKGAGATDGQMTVTVGAPCFYLGVNRVAPNQTCGVSDLYASLDLIGQIENLIYGAAGRSLNLAAFSLHADFKEGTSQDKMNEILSGIKADVESGDGRVFGTQGVEVKAIAAALQAGEWATLEKMLRVAVLIGLGPWPVHAFSEAGGTNVTAAAEQGAAITNVLLDRQNEFRRFLLSLCWYMLRQYPEFAAIEAANPDLAIELPLPVIVAKDTTRESNVLAAETNLLLAAVSGGLIELPAAQRNFREQANRYGLEVLPEDAPDAEEFQEKQQLSARAFDLDMPEGEPDDPRGGHREEEAKKPPEGTPRSGRKRGSA